METKQQNQTPRFLFNVDLTDKNKYQPVHFTELYESFIAMVCQFDATPVDANTMKLNSINVRLKKISGLINMSLYRVQKVERGNGKDDNEITVTIDLKIYENKKDQYTYYELDNFNVKEGDYFNFKIGEKIDFEEDDIEYNKDLDRDGFCFAKPTF